MRRWGRVLPVTAGISALLLTAAYGASLEDGKAVFERREDTMKHMGRPLFSRHRPRREGHRRLWS
jgi:hypothetical protein